MPDENRVFDVSKPSKVSPSATSRPVIVGHHPIMNDPMVRGEDGLGTETPQETTKIPVTMSDNQGAASPTLEQAMLAHGAEPPELPHPPQEHLADPGSPAVFSDPQDELSHTPPPEPAHPQTAAEGPFTEIPPEPPHPGPASELPTPSQPEPHIEGLHFEAPRRRRRPLKLVLLSLLLILVAGYLLIDSGVIATGLKLPFHIFKQKTPTVSTPAPTQNQTTTGPSVPNGFKEYKLSGTNLTFAAPATWGDPTSTTDPGYSKRSPGAAPDGTYAYLVNFATNKDIQIAVTSSKFLPTSRGALYYDFLQWCAGTNDGLIYQSVLNFSTANKVDTPTTTTCNQGPLAGASKIDNLTIIQAKAADSTGKVMGDIYTKNLSDPSLVVFRVKDAVMTNGTDIKQLLKTIQITASPASSASTP